MACAGCPHSFTLCKGQRLEDTALYVGKGKLCGEVVAFWHNDDGCRFSQADVELCEKGTKNNQEVGGNNEVWDKVSMPGLRRRYKRLVSVGSASGMTSPSSGFVLAVGSENWCRC